MSDDRQDYDHIVLISIDTLRSDAIASHPAKSWPGKYAVTTRLRPSVLDELAATGAWFSNCVSAAPYTSASHASFLTGSWPLRHGVFELFNRPLRIPTVFGAAREAGYRTSMKVDFPLMLGEHLGFTRDVDEYVVADDEAAIRFLDGEHGTFSLIHFSGAHIPYGFAESEVVGEPFSRMLQDLEERFPGETSGDGPGPAPLGVRQHRRYLDVIDRLYRIGSYDALFSLYLDGINRFVSARFEPFIRRLLAKLSGSRWLLVLFGDHGEEYEADSFAHQNSLSDGVLRVPVLFLGADVQPGHHSRRIRSIDVAPSLLDIAGITVGSDVDGTSLAPTIRSGEPFPVRDAFAQSYIADGEKHAEHLKRTMLGRGEPGSLPHTLLQEAAYVDSWRLVRRWARQYVEGGAWRIEPIAPQLRCERERPDLTWEPADLDAVPETVLARLDEYRAIGDESRDDQADGGAGIEPQLRAQLQAMGYRI